MIAAAAPTGRAFRGVSGSGGCAAITAIFHHPQIARNNLIYYFAQGRGPRDDTPTNPQIKPQNYRTDTGSMSRVLDPGRRIAPVPPEGRRSLAEAVGESSRGKRPAGGLVDIG